jgi:hypothetical protein
LPLSETTLFAMTRTSIVNPRYGAQDWFCITAPFLGDRRYARYTEIESAFRIPACSSHRPAVTDDRYRYSPALTTAVCRKTEA